MNQSSTLIVNAINNFDEFREHVQVSASHELIELVSEQLYQSPLKAIEELVVNAYDGDKIVGVISLVSNHILAFISKYQRFCFRYVVSLTGRQMNS